MGDDERKWAAWAHAMALLHIPGLLVTLALWLHLRERDPWAAGQARRALRFQLGLQGAWTIAALLAAAGFRLAARAGWPAPWAVGWALMLLAGLLAATVVGAGLGVWACLGRAQGAARSGAPG